MNFIADIIIILILVTCVFFGLKRGLTGVIVKLLSIVISLILSLILFKPVSTIIINNTNIYNDLVTNIESSLNSKEDKNVEESAEPNIIVDSINKQMDTVKENTNEVIAKSIAEVIINLIVIIVLFIIINIIMFFLKFIFGAIASLPIIKQLDKLGGFIYGVIEGFLIIYIILAILSFINIQEVQLAIKTSYLASMLYNNNLLLMLFFK